MTYDHASTLIGEDNASRLLAYAKGFDSFDEFSGNVGWESWMDSFSADDEPNEHELARIDEILLAIYDLSADFPSALKAARTAAGLTQQGMFDVLGIPRRSVQDWETGLRTPPEWAQRLILAELARIAEKK